MRRQSSTVRYCSATSTAAECSRPGQATGRKRHRWAERTYSTVRAPRQQSRRQREQNRAQHSSNPTPDKQATVLYEYCIVGKDYGYCRSTGSSGVLVPTVPKCTGADAPLRNWYSYS